VTRAWLLAALLLAGCSRDPRYTLWEVRDGGAKSIETGLERLVCETLRDRKEADERRASQMVMQMRRDLIRMGGDPGPTKLDAFYRCRPDGESYD
jgi:hypothetical protein